MKYVSIDIETLGLDPEWCDIIEFGAVIDDLVSPLEELRCFHRYLTRPYNRYCGEPYAMSMHSEILSKIANREHDFPYVPYDLLDEVFASWLRDNNLEKINIAGKNFATFDLLFLKKIGFGKAFKYHHRIIDPGSMFLESTDKNVPDMKECLARAGIEKEISHTAVEDALDVVKCIRYKMCV